MGNSYPGRAVDGGVSDKENSVFEKGFTSGTFQEGPEALTKTGKVLGPEDWWDPV